MLHRLYQLNEVSFEALLEKDERTRTYVKNNSWKYYYVLTKLLYLTRVSKDTHKFVKLNMATLDSVLGNSSIKLTRAESDALPPGSTITRRRRRFSTQVVADFLRWGFLLKRFDKKPLMDKHGKVVATYKTIYCKFKDETLALGWSAWQGTGLKRFPREKLTLTGVYATIQQYLPTITIDAVAAHQFAHEALINQLPIRSKKRAHRLIRNRTVNAEIYSHWCAVIDEIVSGNYNLRVDHQKTGRVFTVVSNMPRELRPFLRINGKPLVEIDVSNSQCLVFCIYLLRHYGSQNLPEDVAHYIDLCQRGEFYKEVEKLVVTEGEEVDDDTFKSTFFGKIFFSTETINYKWRQRFDVAFPHVSRAISAAKVQNYKELSIMLSNLESEILIKGVAAHLYRSEVCEFTTIHDSILCTAEAFDECYNAMRNEFLAHGLTPTLKTKKPMNHI